MGSIVSQIVPENPELFALEFGKIAKYDFLYTLSSTNINQSAPKLVQMYITIRSLMSSIMEVIEPQLYELSALESENVPYLTFYILASANIDQSVPNLATIYMLIRSQMTSIMDLIGLELSELYALELENLPYLNLFKI